MLPYITYICIKNFAGWVQMGLLECKAWMGSVMIVGGN